MSKFRRAARIDSNQPGIVKELRKRGFSVELGHDDILVGIRGRTFWYEIKEPETISKSGKPYNLKLSQEKLLKNYKGHYKIVWTIEQILDDINSHD